jgi:hypothetical protein
VIEFGARSCAPKASFSASGCKRSHRHGDSQFCSAASTSAFSKPPRKPELFVGVSDLPESTRPICMVGKKLAPVLVLRRASFSVSGCRRSRRHGDSRFCSAASTWPLSQSRTQAGASHGCVRPSRTRMAKLYGRQKGGARSCAPKANFSASGCKRSRRHGNSYVVSAASTWLLSQRPPRKPELLVGVSNLPESAQPICMVVKHLAPGLVL